MLYAYWILINLIIMDDQGLSFIKMFRNMFACLYDLIWTLKICMFRIGSTNTPLKEIIIWGLFLWRKDFGWFACMLWIVLSRGVCMLNNGSFNFVNLNLWQKGTFIKYPIWKENITGIPILWEGNGNKSFITLYLYCLFCSKEVSCSRSMFHFEREEFSTNPKSFFEKGKVGWTFVWITLGMISC